MTNLTPAQKRLIADARTTERNTINFYGIPEKTRQKLIDDGLVEIVFTYSDDEKNEIKGKVHDFCDELQTAMAEGHSKYQTTLLARNIKHNVESLFYTINVLTEAGKTVSLD